MENKATKSIWAQRIPIKEQLAITKRIFRFAKHFKFEFLIAIVFSIVSSVAAIYMPRTIQFFMDQYLAHHTASSAIIWAYAGMYAALCVIVAIADFTWNYAFSLGKEKTLEAMRRSLYRKLHQLGMRYFDQTPAGSILSRVTNDTMTISDYFQVFSALFLGLISIVTATVAMYATNHAATLLVLAFIPIYVIVITIYLSFISKIYREYRERNSLINAKLNESLTGIAVIQEFRQEKRVSESFAGINDAQLRTRNRMIRMNSFLLSPLNNLLYSVALTLVLVYFGFPLRETFVPAGIIYVFSQYVANFFNPLSNMMDSLTSFTDGIIAGKRIFHILDETEYEPLQQPVADQHITAGKIEFKHVTFSYDGKTDILHDVSFTVEAGQTLGIVGHTGSGKSSIINVMMRFYEFGKGQVLIDGKDIRTFSKAELRQKMGLVLQEPFMFYGDVASNIRLYNDQITDAQIKAAAETVQVADFIESLPDQYHEKVFAGGSEFSSGQRQLISFARTLVTNPKILVLDEATANVDTETESLIQAGLRHLRQGRTTLAIAHRLSTISDADQIIVLDQGRIIERGRHEELLAKKGYYYNLYQLQQATDLD